MTALVSNTALGRGWAGPAVIVTGIVLLALCGPSATGALRYDRAAIGAGEWWRLVSCSWVHLNGWHAAMNAAGLVVLVLLCPPAAPVAGRARDAAPPGVFGWLWRLTVLTLGMSAGLWWGAPQVTQYVGLSGALYGLYVLMLAPAAARGDGIAVAALCLLGACLAAELTLGSPAAEERLIGGRVIAAAHAAGVAAALVYAAVALVYARTARAARHTPAT